ncbi:CPBP family intramembrane glutamic endopeptidase [Acidicapsa ligni]|uniref:CPBP family intramembrane glutamic endopeptidase n=1 Tax=Acidicapsa ligni TaxID=542300 RepID=UPI0021DFAED1|nr:type II CAAX endopeptidase family protein [Acidicapsa ligni]
MWYFVRNDAADYAAFKLLTETSDRQKRYRIWTLKSFLLFFGTSLLGLAFLGKIHSLSTLPAEFAGVAEALRAHSRLWAVSKSFLIGFSGAIVAGMVGGSIAATLLKHKKNIALTGDFEPLLPRNWAETFYTALLSLNAGLSEEFFFRLLIPLLLTLILGKAMLAFVLAAILFGLIHAYQGWVGVLATTVVGTLLTVLYVWTGNIWIAAGAHALLDLLNLVVRPSITRIFLPGDSKGLARSAD